VSTVNDYRLGAPRMKTLERRGQQAGRTFQPAGDVVPDTRYRCHAVTEDGRALCGDPGPWHTLNAPTWRTSAMVPKCFACVRLADAS
jgi:hypothetical protein